MKNLSFIFLLIISLSFDGKAQLESAAGNIEGFNIDKWYEVSVDSNIIQKLSTLYQPKDRPYQFAFPVPVDLNPGNSGFVKRSGSELIWTIGIRSAGARSLNVILKPFNIPSGAYIYVYDNGRKIIRGAFGADNNSSSGILPVMPVPGDEMVLEYHFPAGSDWIGTLGISQISHDFLGILGTEFKDGFFGSSQSCNVDVNCPEGTDYAIVKRAVCRIIISGIELCSGVLVNNTNQENRALIVTAQHCISTANLATTSLFVFGYESPWCKGPDGHAYHSISGSVLRATNTDIDFSLVELTSFPPFSYQPYLAGWDVTSNNPGKTVAIHHPMGDVKKISVDLNSPETGTYSADYITNGFWKILQWDKGTTEGGSSGCPLFNQSKRVVGILTGGEARCGLSINDYFAKLNVSYNLSPYLWMQLKGWIDPAVSGAVRFDGRDPYSPNLLTVDTLSNLSPAEQRIITPFTSGGSGYSTGYNSDSLFVYAEYFKNPLAKQISEILLNIAVVKSVLPVDSVSVAILSDGPSPGALLARQKIMFSEAKDTFVTKVDFKNTIPAGGNFYVAWRIYYHTTAQAETRQFALFHSPDRADPALNTAWFYDGASWKKFTMHPFAPMSVSLDVKVVTIGDPNPVAINSIREDSKGFEVYPNPAREKLVISSENIVPEASIGIYDIHGVLVYQKLVRNSFPGKFETDISSIRQGVYYLLITSEGTREVHKLVIGF